MVCKTNKKQRNKKKNPIYLHNTVYGVITNSVTNI